MKGTKWMIWAIGNIGNISCTQYARFQCSEKALDIVAIVWYWNHRLVCITSVKWRGLGSFVLTFMAPRDCLVHKTDTSHFGQICRHYLSKLSASLFTPICASQMLLDKIATALTVHYLLYRNIRGCILDIFHDLYLFGYLFKSTDNICQNKMNIYFCINTIYMWVKRIWTECYQQFSDLSSVFAGNTCNIISCKTQLV